LLEGITRSYCGVFLQDEARVTDERGRGTGLGQTKARFQVPGLGARISITGHADGEARNDLRIGAAFTQRKGGGEKDRTVVNVEGIYWR